MAQQKQDFQRQPRRKYCQFCKEETEFIDYKDTQLLRKYMTDRGKIKPRRVTGTCTQHQHDIALSSAHARWHFCPTLSLWFPAAVAVVADNLSVLQVELVSNG